MTESWASLTEILEYYSLGGFVSSKCFNHPAQLHLLVEKLAPIPCKKGITKALTRLRREAGWSAPLMLACNKITFSCADALLYAV